MLAFLCRATLFSADKPPAHFVRPDDSCAAVYTVDKRDSILIIDDEPSVADALRLILEDQGHRVLVATAGRAGLDLSRREPVGVVITDLRLPDISGFEVLAALRAESPHVRAILITSHGTPESFAEALSLGAVACLSKPFAPADIVRLVEQISRQ